MEKPQKNNSNIDPDEIAKFASMADSWWDLDGKFKPLHELNPLRLNYIDEKSNGIFQKQVLDVGCGGGILSESMAKLGAYVTGIDMAEESLVVARLHAIEQEINVEYIQTTVEEHACLDKKYDVITCMEMLEHVPSPESIIRACSTLLKPNGRAFFSTINRNAIAYLQMIVAGEHILRILPIGTHSYNKFIRPHELIEIINKTELFCDNTCGIGYNPLSKNFFYSKNLCSNYMVTAGK